MEGRKRTPMLIREREEKARGSGPVNSYKLSPEELEEYRRKTGEPTRKLQYHPSVDMSPEKQRERAMKRYETKEEEPMSALTKERYLQLRLQGKNRMEIMKEHFTNTTTFYGRLSEWGIKDKVAEESALISLRTVSEGVPVPDEAEPMPEPLPEPEPMPEATAERAPKPVQNIPRVDARPLNDLASLLDKLLEQYGINGPVQDVIAERKRQDAKWGQQDHEPHYWTGILGEEFGELCEAVNETVFDNGAEARRKGGYENMRREAVQVAAVAIGFVEALDRRYLCFNCESGPDTHDGCSVCGRGYDWSKHGNA